MKFKIIKIFIYLSYPSSPIFFFTIMRSPVAGLILSSSIDPSKLIFFLKNDLII